MTRDDENIEFAQNVIGMTLLVISFLAFLLMAYSFGGNN